MRLGFLLIGVPTLLMAQQKADLVARGKYVVESVAVCQDCHTPRLENRELDRSKWMKGAVMEYAPLSPIPNWHKTSPDLTPSGTLWKKWGPEAIVNFLHTGKTPKGTHAGPPMPTYTMTREDAAAVVEYLKTLP